MAEHVVLREPVLARGLVEARQHALGNVHANRLREIGCKRLHVTGQQMHAYLLRCSGTLPKLNWGFLF